MRTPFEIFHEFSTRNFHGKPVEFPDPTSERELDDALDRDAQREAISESHGDHFGDFFEQLAECEEQYFESQEPQ